MDAVVSEWPFLLDVAFGAEEEARALLAETYLELGRTEEAIPLYEALIVDPERPGWRRSVYQLAWCHYRQNHFDRALELLDTFLTHPDTGGTTRSGAIRQAAWCRPCRGG